MDRETELNEQLRALQEEYRDKAQPIVDELIAIANLRPMPPIIIYADNNGDLAEAFRKTLQDAFNGPTCGDPTCEACYPKATMQ